MAIAGKLEAVLMRLVPCAEPQVAVSTPPFSTLRTCIGDHVAPPRAVRAFAIS